MIGCNGTIQKAELVGLFMLVKNGDTNLGEQDCGYACIGTRVHSLVVIQV